MRTEHLILGLDGDVGASPFLGDDRSHAARRITAGRHLAAVGVPDAHEHVSCLRGLEHDELVAADAFLAVGDGAHRVRAKHERARPRIDHDEVVAEPVHLAEVKSVRVHVQNPKSAVSIAPAGRKTSRPPAFGLECP